MTAQPPPAYLDNMDVSLTPDQEARLSQVANQTGKNAEQLVREAVDRWLEEDERFLAAVEAGKASADRGNLLADEEVRAWLESRERS